ncbi:AbgT family transporter [Opitutaceae bacterium]
MTPLSASSETRFQRALNRVERVGNALPHPATLFLGLSVLVVLVSWAVNRAGIEVEHPVTGRLVVAANLLSLEGIRQIILGVLPNFIGFAPLGSVLMSVLGLSVAEHSGLLAAMVRVLVQATPARILTWVVVFTGTMSHSAGDVGYVLLLPLSAALFHSVGRHPLTGLAAALAGVSGGFAANLLLSPTDVILSGLTQESARMIDPTYVVTPMANYFFLAASVLLVTATGTLVTERLVEPRLGRYKGDVKPQPVVPLTAAERRGLRWAAISLVVLAGVILAGLLPDGGVLQNPKKPGFVGSYFVEGLVFFIFLFGLIPGIAYGLGAGTIRSDSDVYKGMQKNLELMASYIVVVFFISQFVNLFGQTRLGVILAIKGAALLGDLQLGAIPLLLGLVVLTMIVDIVFGSASAKWAILAAVFVPMFMLLGYTPELTQVAYRVGDSITNIMSPLSSNFPLILMFVQRYAPKAGIGTTVALFMPYSLCNFVCWSLFLVIWLLLGWPIGPGAEIHLVGP